MREHRYEAQIEWTGNIGEGTRTYRGYRRDHVIRAAGKPDIPGSSDPQFHGDPSRYNPEELLVVSLSACHMLWYLHLCAVNDVVVVAYRDAASGRLEEQADGSGTFVGVTLRPKVQIRAGSDPERARALHEDAHRFCFIASSVRFPVEVVPEVTFS